MPFFTGTGQAVSTTVDGSNTGTTGRLRIEPDQLDAAIAVFQEALDTVEREIMWARESLDAIPLARDTVSNDAAAAFNGVGYINDNSALRAWEGAVVQLRSIIDQLRASRHAITRTDEALTTDFQVL